MREEAKGSTAIAEFQSRLGLAVIARRKAFKTLALEALARAKETEKPLEFSVYMRTETTLFDAFRAMRAEVCAHEAQEMAVEMTECGLSDHDIFLLLGTEK